MSQEVLSHCMAIEIRYSEYLHRNKIKKRISDMRGMPENAIEKKKRTELHKRQHQIHKGKL